MACPPCPTTKMKTGSQGRVAKFIKVANTTDLAPDRKTLVEGELHGDVIVCPRHGARFNVKTGAVRILPDYGPMPVYQVRVEGDDVLIAPK